MKTYSNQTQTFEQQIELNRNNAKDYNAKIINVYLKKSLITLIAYIIMLIMFIVSVVMTYAENSSSSQKYGITHLNPIVLIKLGANFGFRMKNGQIYRCITPIFLHAGIQHFFLNSISIIGFMMTIQQNFKKSVYFLAFFLGGIQGNLLSLFANFINQNDNVIAVGASTSICSILGLYLSNLYIISLKNGTSQNVKKRIGFMVGYLLLISILPGVDFYGHFGSFIAGILIGFSFSGLKHNYGEDSLKIKKFKIISLILYANYTIFLLSIFLI